MYSSVNDVNTFEKLDLEAFKAKYYKDVNENNYHPEYRGYYNGRHVNNFDIDEAIRLSENGKDKVSFTELFTDEKSNLPKRISSLADDIAKLDAIIENRIESGVKSFDFKGTKYPNSEAASVKELLNQELLDAENQVKELDKDLFVTAYKNAETDEQQKLKDGYTLLFKYQEQDNNDYEIYNNVWAAFSPLFNTMPYAEIERAVAQLYNVEKRLKTRLQEIANDDIYKAVMDVEQTESIEKYLSNNWTYFAYPDYDNEAIATLEIALSSFIAVINERTFKRKKNLLELQLNLLINTKAGL